MSAQSTYSSARNELKTESAQRLDDASKLILLREHESLLWTAEPVRIANRILLIAIVVLQIVHAPLGLRSQIALLIAGALAACFWFLQEFLTSRRLGRLGGLIASTSGELVAELKDEYRPPVTLPTEPPRKSSIPWTQSSPSAEASESPLRATPEQIWTDTYVRWLYEARKDRNIQIFQQAEPIVWFGLALVTGMLSLR